MPYIVDFQLKGMQSAIAQMHQFAQAAKAAQAAAGGIGGSGGGAGSSGSTQNVQAQAMRMQAQMNNASAQLMNSQIALTKAFQRLANSLSPKSSGAAQVAQKMFQSAVSKVGSGGIQILPMIGELLSSLAELGPEGMAAAAALAVLTAGIVATIATIKEAMDYGVSFGKASFQGGGTAAETGRLAGIGAAAGYSATDMAGMARQWNESVKQNPYALGTANAHGYAPNYGGSFGPDIDYTKRLTSAIQDMLSKKSDVEAERMAQGNPVENFLWLRNTSKDVQSQFMNQMNMKQDPKQVQEASNAQARIGMIMSKFSMLIVDLGSKALPTVNKALQWILDHADAIATVVKDFSLVGIVFSHFATFVKIFMNFGGALVWVGRLVMWVLDLIQGHIKKQPTYEDTQKDLAGSQAKQQQALDQNTQAMTENTKALDKYNQVIGGGENARYAIPRNYFEPYNYNLNKAQISLGQIPM